jgi:16S rRNA (uracil1498-N3)-methyltransferase
VNDALRHSAAHLFVDSLDAPELAPDDAHHLFRVLRVRDGESVTVSDGIGGWRAMTVAGQALVPDGEVHHEPPPLHVTIATAIPKGDRLEWMVQKLTEIGVAEIVFLHCERSVVRWTGDRVATQLERQRRVARDASSQSRRVWLPQLSGPVPAAEVAARPGVIIADPAGSVFEGPRDAATVMIGPEGGWTATELGTTAEIRRWGANVLRVETAALVVAVSFLI